MQLWMCCEFVGANCEREKLRVIALEMAAMWTGLPLNDADLLLRLIVRTREICHQLWRSNCLVVGTTSATAHRIAVANEKVSART